MRSFRHFLSTFTVLALMSGPALVAHAQSAPDNEQYDSPANTQPNDESAEPDNQSLPEAQPAPEPDYDQEQSSQQPAPAPTYDDQTEIAQNNQQPPVDPPARAARLQYMSGSVSVQPQGTGEWVAGELNRPLTNSDNIWADKDSRAEISVGAGLIRLGSESSLTLTNIGENVIQLQLHQGALSLHVRRLYDGEKYEVDTPNQAFTVEKPGDYRFDVNPDADKTIITVWRGEGESTGDGTPIRIHANEQVRFSNGTSLNAEVHGAPAPDAFDQWAQQRDDKLDHSQSARYVSPDMVGTDDLDEYGVWKETPDYGAVWYPTVSAGWSPYYDGHWVYEYPWGWTWVDYEPWGFAPFHYGRWVYWGGGWGWAPGPIYARPYYAPALVAWFGGGGWGVGVGFGGGFGWCPLGWGEPYIPWYGVSRGYFNRVNITNTRITNINITNIYNNHFVNGRFNSRTNYRINYANMRVRGGFTAASRATLVNSLSVARNGVRVAPHQLGRVTPVHSLGIRPTRTSMLGSTGARAAVPPQRAFSRPVVSRLAAPRGLNAGARGAFNGQAGTNGRGGFNGRPGMNPAQAGIRGTVAQPGAKAGAPFGGANRGPVFNNSRPMPNANNNARPMPQNSQRQMPNAGGNARPMSPTNSPLMPNAGMRSVPRPPSAGGNFAGRDTFGSGGMNAGSNNGRMNSAPQIAERNNVPRPSSSMGRSEPSYSQRGGSPNYSPRPASPSYSPRAESPSYSPRGGSAPNYAPRGGSSPQGGMPRGSGPRASYVPRPSPDFVASNRANESLGRTSQSYSRPSQSYGRSPSYGGSSGRPAPSYDRGNYSRPAPSYSRPAPSYGGSYGRASAGPSYGGGSYSRPAPSYGGGSFGRSMPSYGGGHSSPSYGGGARSSGGFGGGGFGGGRSPGGFGGGHSGGGFGGGGGGGHVSGGGGGHSGGGGHGGHR